MERRHFLQVAAGSVLAFLGARPWRKLAKPPAVATTLPAEWCPGMWIGFGGITRCGDPNDEMPYQVLSVDTERRQITVG